MEQASKWAQAYWPDRIEALIVELGGRLTQSRVLPLYGGYENEERDFIVGRRGVRTQDGYHDGFSIFVKEDAQTTDAEQEWRSLYSFYTDNIAGFKMMSIEQQLAWSAQAPRGEEYFELLVDLLKAFLAQP